MSVIADQPLSELADTLAQHGRRRAFFGFDSSNGRVRCSLPALEHLADALRSEPDFDQHEGIFLEVDPHAHTVMAAFIHKTRRGQAAGGLRHWRYASVGQLLVDGLRLARGMGRKNALAGLWWGGGKGILAPLSEVAAPLDPAWRRRAYAHYGRFISSLDGAYVTAEDVGTRASDMAHVFERTRFVTCVPPEVGGSGNPSPATARGVVCAMEAALDHRGLGTLNRKTIAMQGAGNVARYMMGELLTRGVQRIVATDVSKAALDEARAMHPDERLALRCVAPSDTSLFVEACDVLAPNALGGVLNPDTIGLIQAPIVCGAANNQLLDDTRDDALLEGQGITYVPDFVANRMGIVNCANEQYGRLLDDPAITRHFGRDWDNSVYQVTRRVLEHAKHAGITSTRAANELADGAMQAFHPIWGHRTARIIEALLAAGWDRGTSLTDDVAPASD